ncbi:tetratricopeptide repeat protein [Dendrosporobacter sp. 1207_IL3150]|uniref:tetratricopeptide repeat protein n=1 Tax=Dendrosporobacter sp. 1207_IL3150 TaxID=3084054 RepID=UPI002FD9E0D4
MKNMFLFAMFSAMLAASILPAQASEILADSNTKASISQHLPEEYAARTSLHEQAVSLARNQRYVESLVILRELYTQDPTDFKVAYDYITVLNWSGNNNSAILIYESLPPLSVPDFVLRSVGGAYFQLGSYQKALDIFALLTSKGDSEARLWHAECLMLLGHQESAQAIYNELLLENPNDSNIFLSRASVFNRLKEHRLAAAEFENALKYLPPETNSNRLLDINDAFSAALINMGSTDRALKIIKPYIDNKTANSSMQGNYIYALRVRGQFELAVKEAERLWSDYNSAPLFGLRALAESHIQLKQLSQATQVYRYILTRQPQDDGAQFGLAYARLLQGERAEGLSLYDSLLDRHVSHSSIAANDANTLLSNHHYQSGKALFELVIEHNPLNSSYLEQYAALLRSNGQPRAAYEQYKKLSETAPNPTVGLSGMFRTALAVEDYQLAKSAIDNLIAEAPNSANSLAFSGLYKSKKSGEAEIRYGYNDSHKQLQSSYWDITGEQYIGSNYWLFSGINRTRLSDLSTNEHQTINTKSLGLSYNDINKELSFMYSNNGLNGSSGSYSLNTELHLTDHANLSFGVSRAPVFDVQALSANDGGPIMANSYNIDYFRILSPREDYSIGLGRSLLTDGNQSNSFNLNHTYTLFDKNDRALNRLVYWNRAYFKNQDVVYESPSLRESLGIGYVYKYSLPTSYLLSRLMLNWEHDEPEPLAFSPYARLEYGKDFSPNHSIVLGLEYGLHSDDASGSNLRYSYRQIDGLYRFSW